MSLRVRAFLFQFASFALFFLVLRYLIDAYTGMQGLWIPVTAAVVSTLLSPQFKVVRSREGEQFMMYWWLLNAPKRMG